MTSTPKLPLAAHTNRPSPNIFFKKRPLSENQRPLSGLFSLRRIRNVPSKIKHRSIETSGAYPTNILGWMGLIHPGFLPLAKCLFHDLAPVAEPPEPTAPFRLSISSFKSHTPQVFYSKAVSPKKLFGNALLGENIKIRGLGARPTEVTSFNKTSLNQRLQSVIDSAERHCKLSLAINSGFASRARNTGKRKLSRATLFKVI